VGNIDSNVPTFTAEIDILKIAIKGNPINSLRNQFGVRAMVNKLILGHSGNAELKKLLRFFGHHNSDIGMKILDHFSNGRAV